MIIGLIAAVSDNQVVAREDGSLPWNMKSDLQHFRHTTERCALLVGRSTFELLPRAMLDKGERHFFVLSQTYGARRPAHVSRSASNRETAHQHLGQPGDGERYLSPHVNVVRSADQAIYRAAAAGYTCLWSIGGPKTWNESLPYAEKLVISRIHTTTEGLKWAPMTKRPLFDEGSDLERQGFHLAVVEHRIKGPGDDHDWSIEHWRRGR